MVKEYWKPSADGFRSWKEPRSWNISLGKNLSDTIWREICTQRLKKMHGSDIIRWVHRPSGKFSVREAYSILLASPNSQASPIWTHLWTSPQWPKISHFLWLLLHRRILTWENLTRKGFQGPSRCCLCKDQQESIDHLMDACPFSSSLWDYVAEAFRHTNRVKGNITESLKH